MHKTFLATGAWIGALAVLLGAFGAHGLRKIVPPETVSTFETGVRYQMFHVFALLFTGILYERFRSKWTVYAGYSFISGIVLFSGSLYILTLLKATNNVGLEGFGILTPIGGLFLISGWISLAVTFSARNHTSMKPV